MKRQQADPDSRMFAAADAVLAAFNSPAGRHGLVEMFVPTDDQPEPPPSAGNRGPFTERELVDAADFLVRAGFLLDA